MKRPEDAIVEQELGDMLRDSLSKQLGVPDPKIHTEIKQMMADEMPVSVSSFQTQTKQKIITKQASTSNSVDSSKAKEGQVEEINSHVNFGVVSEKLLELNEILISLFSKNNKILNKDAEILAKAIGINQFAIRELGLDISKFNQDDYISGLEMPDEETSIKLVIANTQKFYKLAKIINFEIKGKTLIIDFAGVNENRQQYFVRGKITPKRSWNGNEVIDYVYSPKDDGKMFIRSMSLEENLKWTNHTSLFDVKYKLFNNVDASKMSKRIEDGSSQIEQFESEIANILPQKNAIEENPHTESNFDDMLDQLTGRMKLGGEVSEEIEEEQI